MLYPQNGSMANGSRRSFPTAPVAAAVVSDAMIEPRNTPCCQEYAWWMSGTTVDRRPPKRMASMGTPRPSCHSGAIAGSCAAGAVNRALGCAADVPDAGVQSWPNQSIRWSGGVSVSPSHQTSPSSVLAVLVKMQLPLRVRMALGLVLIDVP